MSNFEKEQHNQNEVTLRELIELLWNKKLKIIGVVFLFGLFSVFYSLSLNNIYTSHSVLSVVDNSDDPAMGRLASQYGGLAAMAGIDLGAAGGSDRTDLIIEKIHSREFLKHLLSFDSILINLMAADYFDATSKKIIYDDEKYDVVKKKWIRKPPKGRQLIPSHIEAHEEYLKVVNASLDKKTGFINITTNHLSPIFAASLLELIINEINLLIRETDLNESQSSINYLNEQLKTTQESDIRKSINTLIKSHIETQMFASIKKDYAFTPIDLPFIPEKKSGPTRSIICILITFFGFILTCLYYLTNYFIRDLYQNKKKEII